jgi:adenylate cyclase
LPEGRTWGSTSAVDIDRDGKSIWVAERCGGNSCEGKTDPPILKFDASGKLVKSFGAGLLIFPHGICVDKDGNIWVTDGQAKDGKRYDAKSESGISKRESMKRTRQRVAICAAIALGSATITLLLNNIRVFQQLSLKAQDAHFVFRGALPAKARSDIVIIGIDEKALNNFPELYSFWHPYYADAMKAAADAGAKVFILDVAFGIPVTKYEPDNDSKLAEALIYANGKIPVVTGFVASTADQKKAAFAVPVNMLAAAFGTYAMANLTIDSDSFVRRQELFEAPGESASPDAITRSMALLAAEKILGPSSTRNARLFLGGRQIPLGENRDLTINFAYNKDDRHDTPFYTFFSGTEWETPGVEIHANTLRTLLAGDFLSPVPDWVRVSALILDGAICVILVTSFGVSQTALWSSVALFVMLAATHILFLTGWLLSSSEVVLSFAWALVGGVVYRSVTAEKKSTFFKSAVTLFVGKQVAQSLEKHQKIGLTGKRQMVTIMFSDIRGFTAFCDSKDPAEVVGLLNTYMGTMCAIIVKYGGHVNKFIGDGILAVFSDDDDEAKPGDHAFRAVICATEMVNAPSSFQTGTGLHSGEVVIGNVGSSDKMEFTVLGDTVNLASRLESLNKERKTKLLISAETREMAGGGIDTLYLGEIPVRGKTVPMKLYTVKSLQ